MVCGGASKSHRDDMAPVWKLESAATSDDDATPNEPRGLIPRPLNTKQIRGMKPPITRASGKHSPLVGLGDVEPFKCTKISFMPSEAASFHLEEVRTVSATHPTVSAEKCFQSLDTACIDGTSHHSVTNDFIYSSQAQGC